MNGQLVVLRIEFDRVLAGFVDDLDVWRVVGIVERDGVAGARADDALIDFATVEHFRIGGLDWRRVLAVPQPAQHVGIVDVALLEADQDFVVDLRQELHAVLWPTARCDQARPITGVLVRQPRVLHFDPAQAIWILVVRHDPNDQANAALRQTTIALWSERRKQRGRLESGDREAGHIAQIAAVGVGRAGDEVLTGKGGANLFDLDEHACE